MRKAAIARQAACLALTVGCGSGEVEPQPCDNPSRTFGRVQPGWPEIVDARATGGLLSVWGPRRDHYFLAGGTEDEGRWLEVVDGEARELTLPAGTPRLNWTFGFGDRPVFAAGRDGTILAYDGSEVTAMTTPTNQELWGIWGLSPDDLWAVGGDAGEVGGTPTILRFAEGAWVQVGLPDGVDPRAQALFKVWGTGPEDVFFVGQFGTILRWDGQDLVQQATPGSEDYVSLWGTGPDRIVAVGGGGSGAQVAAWDGATWSAVEARFVSRLSGVWMAPNGFVYAVGDEGLAITLAPGDGGFELVQRERESDPSVTLHAVYGFGDGSLVAVGFDTGAPRGVALCTAARRDP
jgi:hypothetical protein